MIRPIVAMLPFIAAPGQMFLNGKIADAGQIGLWVTTGVNCLTLRSIC
jgi:hypothetical protein